MPLRRQPGGGAGRGARRDRRVTWFAVALIPVALVVTIALGEIARGALGSPAGGETTPPVGVRRLVGLPATPLFVVAGARRRPRRSAGARASRAASGPPASASHSPRSSSSKACSRSSPLSCRRASAR